MRRSPRADRAFRAAAILLSLACICADSAASAASAAFAQYDYSRDQHVIHATDRRIATAGRDHSALREIASSLLADLKQPGLTFAARQALCQRLGTVLALSPADLPDEASLEPLKKLLSSDTEVDLARLALEPVPGAAVDRLFVEALRGSKGAVTLALLQSIGVRRIAAAIPVVVPLLANPDTANAAARALGAIGTKEALATLRGAPNPDSPEVLGAMLAILPQLPASEAVSLAVTLERKPNMPPPLRAAVLRALLDLDPASAADRVIGALSDDDWITKGAVIEWIPTGRAPGLISTLLPKLPAFDTPTLSAVIAALGRRADPAATSMVVAALRHDAAEVRAAAIEALGSLPGNQMTVAILAVIAAGEAVEPAKLARASLARLDGPGVNDAILDGAQHAAAPSRAVFLEHIAARNMTEGLTLLRAARQASDPGVRKAAIGALGEIAPASEQAFILEWALHAGDPDEQSRALRALVSVTQRLTDETARSLPVIAAIEQAPPAVAARAIPVLARLGDTASAACAGRLALRDDPEVAAAAIATLARWTGDAALAGITTAAEKAVTAGSRRTAFQAALRALSQRREPWSAASTKAALQLFRAAPQVGSRSDLLKLLGRADDEEALNFTESLVTDPAVGAAAKYALLSIKANRAGPPAFRASGNAGQLKSLMDGNPKTRWSVPAESDQWLEIDFKLPRPVSRITLDQTGRSGEYPEQYEVYVSDDAQQPGLVQASGKGRTGQTIIELPAGTVGRYVIIRNTGERTDSSWTITELQVE